MNLSVGRIHATLASMYLAPKELIPRQEATQLTEILDTAWAYKSKHQFHSRCCFKNSKFFRHMSCVIFLDDFLHYGIEIAMVMLIANELQ